MQSRRARDRRGVERSRAELQRRAAAAGGRCGAALSSGPAPRRERRGGTLWGAGRGRGSAEGPGQRPRPERPRPPPAPEVTRQSRPPALSAAAAANKRDFSPRPAPRAPLRPSDWSPPPPPAGPRPLPASLAADWSAGGPGGGADWRPGRPSAGSGQGRGCTGAGRCGAERRRRRRRGPGWAGQGRAGRCCGRGGSGGRRRRGPFSAAWCCSVRRGRGRCAPARPRCGLRSAGGAGGGTAGPGCGRGLGAGCGAPGPAGGAARPRGAAVPARCVRAALVPPRPRAPPGCAVDVSAFPWALGAAAAMPPLPVERRTAPSERAVWEEERCRPCGCAGGARWERPVGVGRGDAAAARSSAEGKFTFICYSCLCCEPPPAARRWGFISD